MDPYGSMDDDFFWTLNKSQRDQNLFDKANPKRFNKSLTIIAKNASITSSILTSDLAEFDCDVLIENQILILRSNEEQFLADSASSISPASFFQYFFSFLLELFVSKPMNQGGIILQSYTSSSFRLEALNEPWQIFLAILYSLTAITSFILNVVTVIVLLRCKRSELTRYLINLSVSDLLMSLFSIRK